MNECNFFKKTFSEMMKISVYAVILVLSLLILSTLTSCGGAGETNKNKIEVNTKNLELINPDKLIVVTCSDYPPFESFKSVDPKGIDIDMAYQISNDLDLKLSFKNTDFESIGEILTNHEADLSLAGITVTEDREKKINFSTPYFKDEKVILVKKNSRIDENNIDAELANNSNTLVCQLGSTFEQYAQENLKSISIMTKAYNKECLKAIDDEEANMFLVSKTYAEETDEENYKVVKTFPEIDLYAAALNEETTNLLDAVNTIIEARVKDGTIENIIKKNLAN